MVVVPGGVCNEYLFNLMKYLIVLEPLFPLFFFFKILHFFFNFKKTRECDEMTRG